MRRGKGGSHARLERNEEREVMKEREGREEENNDDNNKERGTKNKTEVRPNFIHISAGNNEMRN